MNSTRLLVVGIVLFVSARNATAAPSTITESYAFHGIDAKRNVLLWSKSSNTGVTSTGTLSLGAKPKVTVTNPDWQGKVPEGQPIPRLPPGELSVRTSVRRVREPAWGSYTNCNFNPIYTVRVTILGRGYRHRSFEVESCTRTVTIGPTVLAGKWVVTAVNYTSPSGNGTDEEARLVWTKYRPRSKRANKGRLFVSLGDSAASRSATLLTVSPTKRSPGEFLELVEGRCLYERSAAKVTCAQANLEYRFARTKRHISLLRVDRLTGTAKEIMRSHVRIPVWNRVDD